MKIKSIIKKDDNSGVLYQKRYDTVISIKRKDYEIELMIEFMGIFYNYYLYNVPEEIDAYKDEIIKQIEKMHDKGKIKF